MNKYHAIAACAFAGVLVALIVCITVYECVTFVPKPPVAAEAR